MFEEFLDHKCNIYHLEEETVNVGFGINVADIKKSGNVPDEKDVCCHFHVKSNGLRVVQKEPYSSLDGEVKLSLPPGTDIRMNDIVEDCRDGVKYRAGKPKVIHGGHHIIVEIFREEGMGATI